MRIRDFLLAVHEACAQRLQKRFRAHDWRIRFSLLQVYFNDDPSVHYEVWVQRRASRIEIGLHFEGERERNDRWAQAMGTRALEIQAQLGDVELEAWTESWTRLHETLPIDGKLSSELAGAVAARLARYIEVLQPIVEEERTAVEA